MRALTNAELQRDDDLRHFLAASSITDYRFELLAADMAPRHYYRILSSEDAGQGKLLCRSLPDDDPRAHPGHLICNSVRLSKALLNAGIKTPKIYAADEQHGYMLVEDFGDLRFDQALAAGQISAEAGYKLAAQVAQRFTDIDAAVAASLPNYYDSHIHPARGRLIEWYLPVLLKTSVDESVHHSYLELWDKVEASLPKARMAASHIDFHIMNLMYLPDQQGRARCGVLDFQGAMRAPYVYDLVNLLGDARRIVDPSVKAMVMSAFREALPVNDQVHFESHYAILSAQFHSRCLGQFIQLAFMGKEQYLQYLPDLLVQFKADMDSPILAPIKKWLLEQGMDFEAPVSVNIEDDRQHISKALLSAI